MNAASATIVADCPRCGANSMTFDVLADVFVGTEYGWRTKHEAAVRCRRCNRISILKVELANAEKKLEFRSNGAVSLVNGDVQPTFERVGFVNVSDLENVAKPPEHLPPNVQAAFVEGAKCFSIGCYNAAAAMFRLCLDLTTKPLLPDAADTSVPQPDKLERRNLGRRIEWLLRQGKLPQSLSDLAHCVREDGNDGAHDGTLEKPDSEDLLDFAILMLERQYTGPERLRLAKERREQRRGA